MKSALDPGCRTALDLDGPQLSAGKRKDEINLGPIGGSVVPESGVKIQLVPRRYQCAGPLPGVGMPVNTALGDQLSLGAMLS